MKCIKGHEVQPLKSPAGYYMGCWDPEEGPVCRITTTYAKDAESAKKLPLDRMNNMENRFCNGCGNCFKKEDVKHE